MIIETDSTEMRWILLKFLKDSLDFLVEDGAAKKTKRGAWAQTWMDIYLSEQSIAIWMPLPKPPEE